MTPQYRMMIFDQNLSNEPLLVFDRIISREIAVEDISLINSISGFTGDADDQRIPAPNTNYVPQ
jgi:hypothetical protein